MVISGAPTVNCNDGLFPPPGPGLTASTETAPPLARRFAGTVTVIEVAAHAVGVSKTPANWITVSDGPGVQTKFVPVAVNGIAGPPELTWFGAMSVRVGGGPVTLKVMPPVGFDGVAAWPG